MAAKQRHDIGRRKLEASQDARRAAERRRAQKARLVRRKKRREARTVDPESITTWKAATRKT